MMRSQPVAPLAHYAYPTHAQRFGYTVAINIGASDRHRGTFEAVIPGIGAPDSGSHPVCPKGIHSSDEFIQGIATNVATYVSHPAVKDKIATLPKEKQVLENAVVFIPGAVGVNNVVPDIINLGLKHLDVSTLGPALKKAHIPTADTVDVVACNDMIAPATADVMRRLKLKGEDGKSFIEGLAESKTPFHADIGMTGGGFGIIGAHWHVMPFAKRPEDQLMVVLSPTEKGHLRPTQHRLTLEADGASNKSLMAHYLNGLGWDTQDPVTQKLLATGNAKIVTQFPVLPDSPREAAGLAETNLFDVTKDEKGRDVYRLKNVSLERHKEAQVHAIHEYVNRVARAVMGNALGGLDEFVIGGPLAGGVRQAMSEDPKAFDGNNLEESIRAAMEEHTNDVGRDKMKHLKVTYQPFNDLFEGAPLILASNAHRTQKNEFLIGGEALLKAAKSST